MNRQFFIFTDGSAIGNPGPAGWAAIVIHGTSRQAGEGELLRSRITAVEDIFRREHDKNEARLETATFPWMSRNSTGA